MKMWGDLFSKQQFIQDKECVIGITLLKSLSDADGNTGLDFDSPGAQCKPTPAYHPLRFRTFQTQVSSGLGRLSP